MRTNPDNQPIADFFQFNFKKEEFRLDSWGSSDFYCYNGDVLVLLEVEKGQKHPNTNVLKVWPYLEQNEKEKILFIHVIRPENNAPKNRLGLCTFTGEKLEVIFKRRFAYVFINGNPWNIPEIQDKISKKLEMLS